MQVSNSNAQLQTFVNTSYTPVLAFPWNCAVDSAGNIYVSNTNGNGVQKLSSQGTQLNFFTTTSPALSYPNQLALDSAGSVYVADSNGYRVVKLNGTTGAQLQVFSLPTGSYPNGVAIDSSNNVWVTETVQGQVWQFSSSGTLLQQLALPANVEPLNNPRGLFVDNSGNMSAPAHTHTHTHSTAAAHAPRRRPAASHVCCPAAVASVRPVQLRGGRGQQPHRGVPGRQRQRRLGRAGVRRSARGRRRRRRRPGHAVLRNPNLSSNRTLVVRLWNSGVRWA